MDAWSILHVVCLLIGSVVSAVLGKFILKFYSTILFTDRNIFTYLSSASVIALQLIVLECTMSCGSDEDLNCVQ